MRKLESHWKMVVRYIHIQSAYYIPESIRCPWNLELLSLYRIKSPKRMTQEGERTYCHQSQIDMWHPTWHNGFGFYQQWLFFWEQGALCSLRPVHSVCRYTLWSITHKWTKGLVRFVWGLILPFWLISTTWPIRLKITFGSQDRSYHVSVGESHMPRSRFFAVVAGHCSILRKLRFSTVSDIDKRWYTHSMMMMMMRRRCGNHYS